MNQEIQTLHDIEKLDWVHKAILWLKKEWMKIVVVSVILTVVGIVIAILNWHVDNKKEMASELMYKALSDENWENKIKLLNEITSDFSHYSVSELAAYAAVSELVKNNKADDATAQLEQLVKQTDCAFLKTLSLFMLADLYLKNNDNEKALESYDRATQVKGNLIKDEALFHKAFVLEKMGKFDDSKKIYEEMIDRLSEDKMGLKGRAEERLIWLSAQR